MMGGYRGLCRTPLFASPLPRGHRIRISPQSPPMLAGVGFRRGELPGLVLVTGSEIESAPRRTKDKIALPSGLAIGRAWRSLRGLLITVSATTAVTASFTTTTAKAAPASAARPPATPVFSWSGFVDSQCSPSDFLPAQAVDGSFSVFIAAHLDEAEAF